MAILILKFHKGGASYKTNKFSEDNLAEVQVQANFEHTKAVMNDDSAIVGVPEISSQLMGNTINLNAVWGMGWF